FKEVRAFVQHYALGPLGHGGVRDFGSRGLSLLRQILKHLSCPDDGHMRGLAEPEYLLLHFSQALPTTFHREIASSNHHTYRIASKRRKQDVRQLFEAAFRLDLQHDA